MIRRRECTSPFLPQVMIRSTSPRTSFARLSVVLIRSLTSKARARLRRMAVLWLASLPSARPFFRCRMCFPVSL
jgi:hypothetical protein